MCLFQNGNVQKKIYLHHLNNKILIKKPIKMFSVTKSERILLTKIVKVL